MRKVRIERQPTDYLVGRCEIQDAGKDGPLI